VKSVHSGTRDGQISFGLRDDYLLVLLFGEGTQRPECLSPYTPKIFEDEKLGV
jgi:hypothetical protein